MGKRVHPALTNQDEQEELQTAWLRYQIGEEAVSDSDHQKPCIFAGVRAATVGMLFVLILTVGWPAFRAFCGGWGVLRQGGRIALPIGAAAPAQLAQMASV